MKKALSIVLVLILVLGLSVSALAAIPLVENKTEAISIDGKVSDNEWGDPIFSGNLDTIASLNYQGYAFDCENGWVADGWGAPDNQSYDVFATKDSEYAYIAVRINNSDTPLYATDTSLESWRTNLTFTLGAYNPKTITEFENNGVNNDIFSCIRIGEMISGTEIIEQTRTVSSWATNGAMTDYTLADEDFSINYDDVENSYTYEVRVPLSQTNIEADDTAFVFTTDFYTVSKNGLSLVHYILGGGSAMGFDLYWPSYLNTNVHGEAYRGTKKVHPFIVECMDYKVGTTASEFSGNIAIDGTVNAAEWGEPVIITSPAHCQATWGNFWQNSPADVVIGQATKVYVTNDKENIYLAVTVDNCKLDTTSASVGELWKNAHLGFSIAKYDETNTVPHIEHLEKQHEQYSAFWIGLVNGTKAQVAASHGVDLKDIPAENYAVKYDETTQTYTYEVKLPISMTNINVYDTRDIALSLSVGASNGEDCANRYNITMGFTNALAYACPGDVDCGMYHKDNALKITLNDTRKKVETFVKDTAPAIKEAVKLDGVITDKEWGGTAVVSTTPGHCQETWGNFWEFDPSSVNPEQNARLYVTNDSKYLYIGATLDEADLDTTCKNVSELYKAAHFNFSISGYDEENTVKRIPFEGKDYEQYTGFMMGLVNGKPASYTFTQGHAAWELPAEDYAIKYDEATRTYTYEVRIPFAKMNVTTNKVAISASIGAPYTKGDGANRFNLTTGSATCGGAGNWAHKDNAMVFILSTNPETGDINVFALVSLVVVAVLGCTAAIVLRKRAVAKK